MSDVEADADENNANVVVVVTFGVTNGAIAVPSARPQYLGKVTTFTTTIICFCFVYQLQYETQARP